MISIIIPVYNVEKFLPQCLDSVLAQSYQDFEVILVDDGSLDNSGTICDEYAIRDNRIVVLHQANAGVSSARNNGIEHSRGEWITIIDSDDFVLPDYLESFKLNTSDADLIIQGLEYYNNKTQEYFQKKVLKKIRLTAENTKAVTAECKLLSVGFPYGKAYRKQLIESNSLKFDTSISYHEDHIFVLQAINAAHNIELSSGTSYKYRCYHSSSSLSSKRHPWQNLNKAADGMLKCLDDMKSRFIENGSDYEKEIYHFAYSPKVDAVFELFSADDIKDRYNCLKLIITRNEIRLYFHPKDFKGTISKYLLIYAPYCVIKLYFMLYKEFRNRKH